MKPNNSPRLTFKLWLRFHDVLPGSNRLFLSVGGQNVRIQVPRGNNSASGLFVKLLCYSNHSPRKVVVNSKRTPCWERELRRVHGELLNWAELLALVVSDQRVGDISGGVLHQFVSSSCQFWLQ